MVHSDTWPKPVLLLKVDGGQADGSEVLIGQ